MSSIFTILSKRAPSGFFFIFHTNINPFLRSSLFLGIFLCFSVTSRLRILKHLRFNRDRIKPLSDSDMSTRYPCQLQSSAINSITISSSSSLDSTLPRDDNSHMAPNSSPSSSCFMRLAMRVSRARWFIFLRRVFHYQNASRSDLGTNPFNSKTWMISELIALLVQITVITFTLALSKKERPIWPMRLWITGYNIGCVLNLMLLYGRYRQQQNGFSFGDIEQQQRSREETRCSHLMNRCRTSLELFFAIWFVIGNVWVFDSRFGSFHYAPILHVLCISLLAWNALCYSFPFLLFLLLCCVVPLISNFLGYNMNIASSDKGASDDQISSLPSWKYKLIDETSDSAQANNDPECCICLEKYKDKEEVRKLPCSHRFHLKCVDQWLRIISCCPLCKQDLPN